MGELAADKELYAVLQGKAPTCAAWRKSAFSALRPYDKQLAKVQVLIAEHTPWPSLSNMPRGDMWWLRSTSFAKALLSLLLFLAQLTEGKHKREWQHAVPHALMEARLKEVVDKADKGYSWGWPGLNEALRELRKKYAKEDNWVRVGLLSLAPSNH